MTKSNKELAVEVAIALINANPRMIYKNDMSVVNALSLESVSSIIMSVHQTLQECDSNSTKE